MRFRSFALVLALAATFVSLPAAPAAKDSPCQFEGVPRIVAVGDVHGAYDSLVKILRAANVIDDKNKWAGGKTHLVQVGDVLDRGPDSRKAVDLYRRLEREAASAGGRVHYLLGNHEALRLLESLQHVSPGEYAAFVTPESAARHDAYVASVARELREEAAKEPLGLIEMLQAFGPDGDYGKYLRSLNAVIRINDTVFLHGGLTPVTARQPCEDINATIDRELSEDRDKTRANLQASLSMNSDGPLWYRGYATETEDFAPRLDEVLAAQHAKTIVVAHTPRVDGHIGSRFGGKVYMIDTGMLTSYIQTGRASALEIVGDTFTAIERGSIPDVPRVDIAGAATSSESSKTESKP